MKRTTKKKDAVRTTPRGTIVRTPVVVPAPKVRRKPVVHAIRIRCANLDCNNRKSYRSPHRLCRSCKQQEGVAHHLVAGARASDRGPYWGFYITPLLQEEPEISGQEPEASYTPLYSPTSPAKGVEDA